LNDRDDLLTEIARLKAELAEAREALKFYASPETYTHGETIRGDIGEAEPGRWTAGKIARMALARNADGDG
jgi:hypothetical protein